MNDQVYELMRAALAAAKHPHDIIQVRACDLADLLEAYDFMQEKRGERSAMLHVANLDGTTREHPVAGEDRPFTKRLARLKKEAEQACDEMNKLFRRVEPIGRTQLCTSFGFVVRSLTKVADEIMAVHQEQFECKRKEP